MIVIILKFKNLNRSIVFSICFIYIFNLSSIVYANHKNKNERFVITGTLVSAGLATVGKAGIVAALCALGIRLGLDMNTTTQSVLDKFIEENPDLINSENFGKSENGLIAVSKNVVDKFTSFLENLFYKNPSGKVTDFKLTMTSSNFHNFYGYTIYNPTSSTIRIFSNSGTKNYYYDLKPTFRMILSDGGFSSPTLVGDVYYQDGKLLGQRQLLVMMISQEKAIMTIPYSADYGTYVPSNELKDDKDNVYTGTGDFILNPSWDIGANKGALEGLPSLPWEDKTFGSTGQVGVLNPDGTITDVPDVDNPDVPDIDNPDTTDKGILGWLTSFWENLWNFCMELVKKLFYPQKAIDVWNNFNSMIWDKFRFLGQLNGIKWSTNNNQRLRIPFTYNGSTYIIQLPDSFEENNVTYFRNIFKYFVYAITLFVCVRILRPRFTIGTR